MATFFNTQKTSLAEIIGAIHSTGLQVSTSATEAVRPIIETVATSGDAAIVEYTNHFDRTNVSSLAELTVSAADIAKAYDSCSSEIIAALTLAAERITAYHTKQLPSDFEYTDPQGVRLGNLWRPITRVGVYVPGGKASYPSSVLMNAIPAKVAGVNELVMVVPSPGGELNPTVLAAAKIAGITEIYRIGGAQAIAALAYGTETIKNVDKIVGPGNAYVAAAKREVFGKVGIDMIAGPSEILVVADNSTDPKWIAADLLSQAEHDEHAQAILITDDGAFARMVIDAVEEHLAVLPRSDIALKSWDKHGIVIVDPQFSQTTTLINAIAPEHLELIVNTPDIMIKDIRNAGAIFVGPYTPEAIGDYTAGPSHVLPTSGNARFSSGLSVYDFLKRMSLIGCSKESFKAIAQATAQLADNEGLGAHALSVRIRTNE